MIKPTKTACVLLPRTIMMLLVWACMSACSSNDDAYPWLAELDAGEGASDSGARLMALEDGLHPLESPSDAQEMLVGVHGYGSEGYEWVYPLQTLDSDQVGTWFYRWDYTGCPQPAAAALIQALQESTSASTRRIHLVGHSYGGVLLAHLIESWPLDIPVHIHVVASPVAGMEGGSRCDYQPPSGIAPQVSVRQWRTRKELDGAFKNMAEDPQNLELAGSAVTRLPEEYRGRRLGHNWSISWVAEQIAADRP